MSAYTMTKVRPLTPVGPTITFIIPVREDARRLGRCLERIAANRYPRALVEVVVVDNGSTDGSGRVALEAGATVLCVSGVTVGELRNRGARVARGEILAFVDADHEIDPEWIASALDALGEERTGAVGAPYHAPANGTWVQHAYDGLRVHTPGRHEIAWLGCGNLAVRAAAFSRAGGFDPTLETCEDVDLCGRLRAAGYAIVSDDRLRSVHLGDPPTLRALFAGELWRGRDNLRMSLRGPLAWRDVPSLAIPVVNLCGVVLAALGLLTAQRGGLLVTLTALATLGALSSLRTLRMLVARRRFTPLAIAQTFIVACVYDVARALAIALRSGHGARRATCASEAEA
jgi:hypothetical protein